MALEKRTQRAEPLPMALPSFLCPVESLTIPVGGFLTSEGPCELLGEPLLDTVPSWMAIQHANQRQPCRHEGERDIAQVWRPGQGDLKGEGP